MIVDDLIGLLYIKSIECKKGVELVIYIENSLWHELRRELIKTENIFDNNYSDLIESNGKSFMGCEIYRVISDNHGIKIFEK